MRFSLYCILALSILVVFSGCVSQQKTVKTTTTTAPSTTIGNQENAVCDPALQSCGLKQDVRVEVYHFHRTSQCWSCKTLGELAEKTVNTYFKSELESGKIVFDHVNVELEENKKLADQYGASGSSLMIGVYDENGFSKEEDTKVWYKLNDEEDYMSYLKSVIEAKLKK